MVLHLRRSGKRNKEIAARLGIPYGAVCRTTSRFIRQGLLQDDRLVPDRVCRKRIAIIVQMTQQGKTLAEIGKVLGVSWELVRRLRKELEAEQGAILQDVLTTGPSIAQRGVPVLYSARPRSFRKTGP